VSESSLHLVFSASVLRDVVGEIGISCVNTSKTYQVLQYLS
jgi:hypothetical protein